MSSKFRSAILCYHAVFNTWPHGLSVTEAQFERQLRFFLRRGFRGGDVATAVAGRHRVLHVTFDDAYVSVAATIPLLERLRIGATIFVCTDYAGDGRILDIAELANEAAHYPEALRTLTWDELRELAQRGVEIGSHTLSHAHLPKLGDAELARELRESKAAVEAHLDRPCRYVAYPFGEEDQRVRAAAENAGYEAGFGLPGRSVPPNRYSLPRIGMYRRDTAARAFLKTLPLARRLASLGT